MSRILSSIFIIIAWHLQAFANAPDQILLGKPKGIIVNDTIEGPIGILTLIQSVLLKVILPVIVVGASLYIAYALLTAEGDESKMKKAWKSLTYSAVGLIAVALSYAFVSIISRISF